jgi:hypothetical protein
MKKIYLIIPLIFVYLISSAQEILWTKKAETSHDWNKSLLAGDAGAFYEYNSYSFEGFLAPTSSDLSTDTVGTHLQLIDSTGLLIFKKHFAMPFYIKKMVFEAPDKIYFTGFFYGTLNVDGFTIKSVGKFDGMIGQMDSKGKILWISTFGGSKNDFSNGLCLDNLSNTLIITGFLTDTLFVNNAFKEVKGQSALVASFTKSGMFVKHKLHDFYPELANSEYMYNSGLEIASDNLGSLFLIVNKKGDFSGATTRNYPYLGNYIVKMNQSFDTLWTKFINEYGYYSFGRLHNLALTNGDIYVLMIVGERYGSTGKIARINGMNGIVVWKYFNKSGLGYSDLLIDKNILYVTGNEGATIYGAEGSQDGYTVIKKFDGSNNLLGETRLYNYINYNIVKNSFDDFYIMGGNTVSKLKNINCSPIELTTNTGSYYGYSYYKCPASVPKLKATTGFSNYHWSTGETGSTIVIHDAGLYGVSAINAAGCTSHSKFEEFKLQTNFDTVKVVLVSTAFEKNSIVIQQGMGAGLSYFVFKETTPGNFTVCDTIKFPQGYFVYYTDQASTPNIKAERYYFTSKDSCGYESPHGKVFRTMCLKVDYGASSNTLMWNLSEGLNYSKQYIYRGTTINNLTILDSVSTSKSSYVDLNGNGVKYYYKIGLKVPPFFYNIGLPFSNIAWQGSGITAISEKENEMNSIVFPNPFEDHISIVSKIPSNISYEILNSFGQIIKEGDFNQTISVDINMKEIEAGIYFIKIKQDRVSFIRKIVKVK